MTHEQQLEALVSDATDLVSPEELLEKLRTDRPLRIKYGADPAACGQGPTVRGKFPAHTGKVGLFLEIEGAPPNTQLSFRWYHGDTLLRRQIIIVSGDKTTITYIYAANQEHLWPGRYAIEIIEKGDLVARLIFTVG